MRGLSLLLLLTACTEAESLRFTADFFTEDCVRGGVTWMGVKEAVITLEHVPSGLVPQALPAAGTCESDLVLLGGEAFAGGEAIAGLSRPRYRLTWDSGALEESEPGLYQGFVEGSTSTGCLTAAETAGPGVELYDAGSLEGLLTPEATKARQVEINGSFAYELEEPLSYGDELALDINAANWDATWVQLRRLDGGDAVQTLTCTSAAEDSFTVAQEHWDELDSGGDYELFVGWTTEAVVETDEGVVQTATRVVHRVSP